MQATLYAWLSWHGRNKEGYYFTSIAIRRASESPRIANWPFLAAPPRLHPPWRISSAVLRLNRRVASFYSLVSEQYRTSTSSFFAVNLDKWLAGMVVFTILFSKYPRSSKMSVIFFSNREIVVRGRVLEAWYFWNIHSVPVFVSFSYYRISVCFSYRGGWTEYSVGVEFLIF